MKTKRRGFTMVEILVVLAIVAVLVAMLLPHVIKGRTPASRTNCTYNLKQVGLGARMWAMDHGDRLPQQLPAISNGVMEVVMAGYIAPVFSVMSNELNTPMVLRCPADNERSLAVRFDKEFYEANVSYFIGLDADETQPQMILTGDDNIELNGKLIGRGRTDLLTNSPISWSAQRHKLQGNVGMADGSVQGFSNSKLREAFANTGTNLIRLAFP